MPKKNREKHPEIIISHPGTDFDSLASMWAVHLLNPNRPVVMIAGTDTNVREFLALYDREFPRLRLKQIDIGSVKHLTVVDCASRAQLSRIEGLLDRSDIHVELWDHHREDGPDFKADVNHYEKVGAVTSMLVQELAQAGIKPSPEEATLFLLGIYEDTGSLRFPSTTPDDLIAASWLLRSGASLNIVDKFLGIRLTQAQKELLTTLSLNVRVVEVRGIDIHVTSAIAMEFVDEIAFLARKVQETENADVLFTLVQLHDRVFIVGRARIPAVNVGQILSIFGGGGHAQAASCLLTGTTHPIALQRLIDVIREQVKPIVQARDIMSSLVRTVDSDDSIEHAHTVIAHTGYSGLVVTDDDNRIIGVITRSNVDKALAHGLGHAPVKGYMIRDPVTIGEDDSLGEIQDTIIEKSVGFLPVIFGGKLSGVVTRSDVLHALHKRTTLPSNPAEGNNAMNPEEFGRELLLKLPGSYLDILSTAGEVADSNGVTCYLVGGIVRDLILSHKNVDIDLLIEGDGIQFAHHLAIPLGGRVVENERFRTAKIILDDEFSIDVATARDEFYIRPGALPEVEATGIRDDLVRRDFTINTLAIQLNARKWGRFIDHFSGLSDLKDGLIRVLHTFSFVDDPTRILRALRFSERFGFKLESQTRELLRRALLEGRLDDISPERVRDEILLCLREDDPWSICGRLCEDGVFGVIHQSLYPPTCLAHKEDPVKPALEWLAKYIQPDELPSRELCYLAYLLSETQSADVDSFVSNYKFDRSIIELAETLPKFREARDMLASIIDKPSDIVFLVENLPIPFWVVFIAGKDDGSPERVNIHRYLTELKDIKTEIDGDDLIKAGFEPGPDFGKVLMKIRRAKLDGEVSTKDEEMAIALKLLEGEQNPRC